MADNVFQEAYSQVEQIDSIVEQRIKDATKTSTDLLALSTDTIQELSSVNFNFDNLAPPKLPIITPTINVDFTLPEITPTSFGAITSNLPPEVSLEAIPNIPEPVIPDFVSSISSLNIPTAPSWTAPSDPPVHPDIGDVIIPDAPSISLPGLPELTEITIPDFAGLTLPTFNAALPQFQGTALVDILQWTEPTYEPEILDEVLDKIRLLWSGGSGIPPLVEQAMVERAMSREDQIVRREIDAVDEEFSLRGFTLPSGLQAARVDQLRSDLTIKKLGLNRELTIEFAKMQNENIKFAIEQGVAAENVFVNLFTNMANRMFDAAKTQLETQISIYNAQVSLFNAQMQGYQVQASVFNTLVQAETTKIEVYKAEIEAEVAKGQINEQKVRTYTAQIQALEAQIDIYKAKMEGAQIQSQIIATKIQAYGTDVNAYAARIQADKVRFDAYESQVKGEVAKANIIESEARAYAALVQGKATIADIDVKRADLYIQKNKLRIDQFSALIDEEKARVQSQLSVIQASAQAYVADTQRYVAIAQAETGKAQVEVAAYETQQRTNISFYQAQVQAYIGNMEQLIRKAGLIVDALKAAGSISSTLAAGAMAAVHVGATLSGGGAVNASGAYSESNATSTSTSTNKNFNFEGTGNE